MKVNQKVIWSEGTILTQQHFQQWEQYLLAMQDLKFNLGQPYLWGVIDIEINDSALQNDCFCVEKCKAVFPDYEIVDYDHDRDGELCCDLSQCKEEAVDIYLCAYLNSKITELSGYEDKGDICGWKANYEMIRDEYDCQREREVAFTKRNLFLLPGDCSKVQCKNLKIAEIRFNSDGRFKLSKTYIPPVITIQASNELQKLGKHIINHCMGKVNQIEQKAQKYEGNVQALFASEPLNLMLIQLLRRSVVDLNAILQHMSHPIKLYHAAVRLHEELKTFHRDQEARIIPPYQHEQLASMMLTILKAIEGLLNQKIYDDYTVINLTQEAEHIYTGSLIDESFILHHDFYLIVTVEGQGDVESFLKKIKMASEVELEKVIHSAISGVEMQFARTAPVNIYLKHNSHCYYINKSTSYWEEISKTKKIALFVPEGLEQASFEMIAVPNNVL